MFWFIIVVLCLLAVFFAIWPVLKDTRRVTPLLAGLAVFTVADQWRGIVEKATKFGAQIFDVRAARPQHLGRRGVVEQCQQQVLDGHELVLLLTGTFECLVKRKFQLFAQHARRTCH